MNNPQKSNMNTPLKHPIEQYTAHLKSGHLAKGYQALMAYLMQLRTHCIHQYGTEYIVGSFHQGYMDMSYFPITPKSLKQKKLKIGLMFNHEKVRFETWLNGQNKSVQQEYWEALQGRADISYPLAPSASEAVIQHVLVEEPDFSQLNTLTEKIEAEMHQFMRAMAEALG